MELHQLRYFDAVARHAHFTRAAEQLHVAQPAVSAQIRRLESELGSRLFTRTTRRVALTQAGELFWVRVRRILDELDGAHTDLDELDGLLHGRVALGAIQSLEPLDLPACLAGFHARHPGIEVILRSGTTPELIAAVRRDELDLAIAPTEAGLPAGLTTQDLFGEDLVLVLAPDHPLTRHPTATLAALREEPFVGLPAGNGLHELLTHAATAAGFKPRVQFETGTARLARNLAARGLGVAVLPQSVADGPGPPATIIELRPRLTRTIGLIRRHNRQLPPASEASRSFITDWTNNRESPEPPPSPLLP